MFRLYGGGSLSLVLAFDHLPAVRQRPKPVIKNLGVRLKGLTQKESVLKWRLS